MPLSPQQAHVLENIDRVLPLPTFSNRLRYQLDKTECTAQITGLTVKKLIAKHSNGGFMRLPALVPKDVLRTKDRQLPHANAIAMIKAALAAPVMARKGNYGKRPNVL